MTEFEAYQPETWFYDGLVVASDFDSPPSTNAHVEQRALPWDLRIPKTLIAAGVFAASSLLLGSHIAGAANLRSIPISHVRTPAFVPPPREPTLSPLSDINRGFNSFFADMRNGKSATASVDSRALAKAVVRHRDETTDIETWARRLAEDVKDAND